MKKSPHWRYFPSKAELERTLLEFESLLADCDCEETAQRFLADHSWLLEHAFTTYWSKSLVLPKFSLGNEFKTDFVLLCWGASAPACIQLIEIEPPDSVVFTKAGDPAMRLTHATRQVVDWSNWIRRNEDFFHREIARAVSKILSADPHGSEESFELDERYGRDWRWFWEHHLDGMMPNHRLKILIGRRDGLTDESLARRNAFKSINDVHFEIISYDRIVDCIKNMIAQCS